MFCPSTWMRRWRCCILKSWVPDWPSFQMIRQHTSMCQLRDPTNQPITVIEKLGKQFSCQRREAFCLWELQSSCSQSVCICVCVWVACSKSLSCRPFPPCHHLLPPYVFLCLARLADASKWIFLRASGRVLLTTSLCPSLKKGLGCHCSKGWHFFFPPSYIFNVLC